MNLPRTLAVRSALVLAGTLGGILLGALLLEGWLRCAHKFDLRQYTVHNNLGENADIRFRPANDILLGWEHDSCTDDDPFGNSERYPVAKRHGVYRVLVLGDSITENGGYVRCLEDLLGRSRHRNSYEVWNCGTGGYNLRQYYYALKDKGFGLDPDLVIIGLCLNDVDEQNFFVSRDRSGALRFFDMRDIRGTPPRLNRTLFFHSYVYRFIMITAFGRPGRPGYGVMADRTLRLIAREAGRRKVPVLAVIVPYLKAGYTAYEKDQYRTLASALAGAGMRRLDLHGAFENIDDPAWRESPGDFIHPSMRGHAVIAEKIFDALSRDPGFWYAEK